MAVALDQRPRGWARFAPLQFRAAGVRQVKGALEGLEALFGRAMRWWGWGEDGHEVRLPEAAVALLRDELEADPAAPPRAGRARRRAAARAPARGPCARAPGRRGGRRAGARRPRWRAWSTPPARATPTSCGCAPATPRARPTLVRRARLGRGAGGGAGRLRRGAAGRGAVRRRHERGGRRGAARRRLRRRGVARPAPASTALAVDRVSLTATLAAGLLGPEAERRLASEGVTLGHFPQSFEYSTVGGWVATRSAGQASTGYGRIDELVEGVRLVAPAGELTAAAFPASAAGPDLRELVVGSEGVLGVISEATLRVRPCRRVRRYEGWSFRSFAEGCDAFRVLEQARRVARRGAALRRGGDAAVARAGVERERAGARRAQLPAPARPRGRLPGDRRLRGRRGRRGAPPAAHGRSAARRRRAAPRAPAGRGLAARPLRRALPARRAARPRRDGRDARDRHRLEQPRAPLRGGSRRAARGAGRARHAGARDVPRVAPVSLRGLALLHLPGPPGERGAARAVARGQVGGQRRDRGQRRHDHPPPRRGPRPRPLDARRGGGAGAGR